MVDSPADAAVPRNGPSAHVADLRELVRQAFAQAQASGRKDWNVMSIAVLKNRLLQISSREFDEQAYGASSMVQLVKSIPETISLDETFRPPHVTLLEAMPHEVAPDALKAMRVRPDLWDAIFDFSSPGIYVWDGMQAVLQPSSDELAADGDLRLPTLTREELDAWRATFVSEHPELDLDAWRERSFSTYYLPAELRGQWNRFMKTGAIDRLRRWFHQHEIVPPLDLAGSLERPSPGSPDRSEVEELRRYVLRCVAVMRPAELRALQIPASVAARVSR